MLQSIFLITVLSFLAVYLSYFIYIKRNVSKPWNINVDRNFEPKISILIPIHNEENRIESKLENIKCVSYPAKKMEVIIADDCSSDNSIIKVRDFMQKNSDLNIKIVEQKPRAGKSATLNKALQTATNPIIVVSDADTLWPSDILREALPYLSDRKVGAVTGRGINKNATDSWITRSEGSYLQLVNLLRLGESKIHSTIRFEGGFCAYKREVFKSFDCETGADDSGTALNIIQNGYRTIMIPDAVFYTDFPSDLIGKFRIKVRRANQLIHLHVKCIKLLLKGRLRLPKRIAIPEITLFIFAPVMFLILVITSVGIVILTPLSPIGLAILVVTISLLIFARQFFFEILINNFILLYALLTFLFKKRYIAWDKR